MDAFKCKMCGGNLVPGDHEGAGACDSCGTVMTLPKISDDRKLNLYNRANHFRMLKEFDKALAAYEMILNEDNEESEAHWGAVLSRYGIEYVEDPSTHKRISTCNRMQAESVLTDPDYLLALEYASDGYSRSLYEAEAKAISEIQRGILTISNKEDPYDVFICYKEQSESAQRTRDSAFAQDIYYQLKQEGYRVFFSRISLEDKLGQEYEPYIFSALNSAKVMVVVGTKPEYFQAVWVKNEWSRYLKLMKQQRSRVLIPCYRDMDAYELPEELSLLQSLDMAKIGFMQDLVRGIKKIVDASKVQKYTAAANSNDGNGVGYQGGPNPLLERAFIFLGDGEFEKAEEYLERLLDQEPRNARAYFVKFLAEHKCQEVEYLTANADESWFDSYNYRKAVEFALGSEKSEIEGYRTQVYERIEKRREAERVRHELERVRFEEVNLKGLRRKEAELIRLEKEEQERLRREEAERVRVEEETKLQREQEKVFRRKRNKWLIGLLCVLVVGVSLWFLVFQDMVAYQQANTLMESGAYYKAYEEFSAMEGYKDARVRSLEAYAKSLGLLRLQEQVEGWMWLASQGYPDAKGSVYAFYEKLETEGDYYNACVGFESINGYKDAGERSQEAYRKYIQQQPEMEIRLEGYQWLLEQGYSQDALYNSAQVFMENDDANAAYPIFKVLVDHKDVKQKTLDAYAKAFPPSTVTFDSGGGSSIMPVTGIGMMVFEPAPPMRSGYVFSGWYKDSRYINKWDSGFDAVTADITLYAKWFGPVSVQDFGPAGGYIFYDKGLYSEGWRYLEAAPASSEWSSKVWGGYGTNVGNTGTAIGTGAGNTEKIVSRFGNAEPYEKKTDYAAKLCADLVVSKDGVAYDDWFLPSKDELNQMYLNLKKKRIGGFSDNGYWSSSEYYVNLAWAQSFGNGYQSYYYRNVAFRVRPVRAF